MRHLLQRNEFFEDVLQFTMRLEFQGRGTLHIHVAAWVIPRAGVTYEGRTGERSSMLLHYSEKLFCCRCDVQLGSGFSSAFGVWHHLTRVASKSALPIVTTVLWEGPNHMRCAGQSPFRNVVAICGLRLALCLKWGRPPSHLARRLCKYTVSFQSDMSPRHGYCEHPQTETHSHTYKHRHTARVCFEYLTSVTWETCRKSTG